MIKANNIGSGFSHQPCSTFKQTTDKISWNYNSLLYDTTFYCEKAIMHGWRDRQSRNKFGWLIETPELLQAEIAFCYENHKDLKSIYRHIFTHSSLLLALDPELFKFVPCTGTWIREPKIHEKTKNVSMITSNKSFTSGHKARLQFVSKYRDKFDLFGRGFTPLKDKEEALCDYRFSVCIENGIDELFFTEKILDCFATGTIPIYLGATKIDKFFNIKGILFIENGEFDFSRLNEELYNEMRPYAIENLENCRQFITSEDWMINNYF